MTILFDVVINVKNASAIAVLHANKFEGKLLMLSTALFFNYPSMNNWSSFLIKYSLVTISYWPKIEAKAESENQSEIEDTRLVLKI